ncbi:hypothetical protein FACS189418_7800 [Clostridia bacterium]|nr:hypothetical protein FACS189418_7800 [Clostridia bacterium]
METIKNFFLSLPQYIEQWISVLIPVLITASVNIIIFTRNEKPLTNELAREYLNTVYFPLFQFVEPYLYKKIPLLKLKEFLKYFEHINSKYPLYISSDFRHQVRDLAETLASIDPHNTLQLFVIQHDWNSVCFNIDRLYDRYIKKASLPLRSKKYRFYYRQYYKEYPWDIHVYLLAFLKAFWFDVLAFIGLVFCLYYNILPFLIKVIFFVIIFFVMILYLIIRLFLHKFRKDI